MLEQFCNLPSIGGAANVRKVKPGKAQNEQMFSALPLIAADERTSRIVSLVPGGGILATALRVPSKRAATGATGSTAPGRTGGISYGCLRPPCGGTDAMVPSMILSSACCTPSPETSRVIERLSDLRLDHPAPAR